MTIDDAAPFPRAATWRVFWVIWAFVFCAHVAVAFMSETEPGYMWIHWVYMVRSGATCLIGAGILALLIRFVAGPRKRRGGPKTTK
jgi:hypothetical protein